MVVKCRHKLVITNEKGEIEYEVCDRRKRIMKRTLDYLIESDSMSPEEILSYMKDKGVLRLDHLVKYAFTRGD